MRVNPNQAMERKSISRKQRFGAEREFGLIVGSVFTLLGGLSLYLNRLGFLAQVKLTLGVVLIVAGLFFPVALALPRRGWMALAMAVFSVITNVALALVYFLVFVPFGFILKLRGWDPLLRRSAPARSYWSDYSERQRDVRHYERMY